jgi:hypothetical protein
MPPLLIFPVASGHEIVGADDGLRLGLLLGELLGVRVGAVVSN